jgi:phosphoribosyl-AMP cyclohydrolase
MSSQFPEILEPELRAIYQTAPTPDYGGSIVGLGTVTREELLAALNGEESLRYVDKNGQAFSTSAKEVLINCNLDSLLVRMNSTQVGPPFSTIFEKPDFSDNKLIRAITVDESGNILMDAFMNEQAYDQTQEISPQYGKRRAVYFSRSREKLWPKGDESGNIQEVIGCNTLSTRNAVLLVVHQVGNAACHDGYRSCFYRRLLDDASTKTIANRIFDPEKVYKK